MSADEEEARAARARARSTWPGAVRGLDAPSPPEALVSGPPGELVAMVTELTLQAWAMRGMPLPDYPRSEAPGRVIRDGPR